MLMKKFKHEYFSIKAYEKRLLHKNWVIFAIVLWHRKNMVKNAIYVYTDKETLNTDPSKFETFEDARSKFVLFVPIK